MTDVPTEVEPAASTLSDEMPKPGITRFADNRVGDNIGSRADKSTGERAGKRNDTGSPSAPSGGSRIAAGLFEPRYLLALIAGCVAGFGGLLAITLAAGKQLIWSGDALNLYLNFFVYEGEAIRSMVASLAAGQGLQLPLYTFDIGYGADVYLTMGGSLNDPLNLLAALCPPEYAEYLFVFTVFLRVLLAAAAMSYYCLRRGSGRRAALIASLMYAFCGFSLFQAILYHPNFLNTAALFPLILAGGDKLFEGGRPHLLIVALALQFTLSVYFSFMSGVMLIVYCLVKYAFRVQRKSILGFVGLVGRFLGCTLLSLAMSAAASLPLVLALLSQGRVSLERDVTVLAQLKSYLMYANDLVNGTGGRITAYIGAVGVLLVIAFFLLWRTFEKDERRAWGTGLALAALVWAVPWLSHLLNGMSYSTDRWMYGFSFCLSYIACLAIPKLPQLRGRKAAAFLVIAAIFALLVWPLSLTSKVGASLIAIGFLALAAAAVWFARGEGRRRRLACGALACLVVAQAVAVASLHSSPILRNPPDVTLLDTGSVYPSLTATNSLAVAAEKPGAGQVEGEACRVSRGGKYNVRNAGLPLGVRGVDFFSSYYIQDVDDLRTALGLADTAKSHIFVGHNDRFAVDAAMGARYYVLDTKTGDWRVPFGYAATGESRGRFELYETKLASPLAFASASYAPASDFWAASTEQRQEYLANTVVLDDNAPTALEQASVEPHAAAVPFQVTGGDGAELSDGKVTVSHEDGWVELSFKGAPSSENYLAVDNLTFKAADHERPGAVAITAECDGRRRTLDYDTAYSAGYSGRPDWVLNLGYSEKPLTEMKVKFSHVGTYSFNDLRIAQQPVEPLVKPLRARQEHALGNLEMAGNRMSADIDTSRGGPLAMFTVPYSQGWSATVDGQPANILKADIAFMAVETPADGGMHHIELAYETPGLRTGIIASALATLAFVALVFVLRRRSGQQPGKNA